MSEDPIAPARPLITVGDVTAEVCVDGWCGPVAAGADVDGDQESQPEGLGGRSNDGEI